MTDRELLEYIAAQVGTLTSQVDTLTKGMTGKRIENGLKIIEGVVVNE